MRNVKKALVVGALAPLALTLFLLAFLWPMATMEPRDISTAVVGEPQQVAQIQKALDEKKPGLLKTQPASDRAEAERIMAPVSKRRRRGTNLAAAGAPKEEA